MKVPTAWREVDEAPSTQDIAADLVRAGESVGVVFAHHQTQGRGRFDRPWDSERGQSLTMSLVFPDYADHPMPWLVGMAVAIAAAESLDCRLRWPNDLSLKGKKLGGILTELVPGPSGALVPVVGVGINLGQAAFPADLPATSLILERGQSPTPTQVAKSLLEALPEIPEPTSWLALEGRWQPRDDTPGKRYLLPTGERAVAVRVGEGGELIARTSDGEVSVLAGDALFG